jgi:tyrosinase
MSHFVISGAKGGSTQGASAPNRLEINDLINNGDQFSLYIQALSKPLSGCICHPMSSLIPK